MRRRSVPTMSADDATTPTTTTNDGDRPPFDDHDFGGQSAPDPTPEHVEPYASREDGAQRTSPVAIPEHVEPYSSRD